jgi:hypothetical protein
MSNAPTDARVAYSAGISGPMRAGRAIEVAIAPEKGLHCPGKSDANAA